MSFSIRQRKTAKRFGHTKCNGRIHLTAIRKFRSQLIDNATLPEMKFRKALDQTGIPYEFQKIIKIGRSYKIVDFFLFNYNIVVEIDGSYHFTAFGQYEDNKRTEALKDTSRVDDVIRFSNRFVLDHIEDELIATLHDLIEI